MKYRIIVSAIIKNNQTILLGKKPPGKGPYPDTWHFPGGGVNIGHESCEEAITREIMEETGITIKNLVKASWDTDIELDKNQEETYYIFLQYVCEFSGGILTPKDDLQRLEWVDVSDLSVYNLNKPAKKLLKKLKFIN